MKPPKNIVFKFKHKHQVAALALYSDYCNDIITWKEFEEGIKAFQ